MPEDNKKWHFRLTAKANLDENGKLIIKSIEVSPIIDIDISAKRREINGS